MGRAGAFLMLAALLGALTEEDLKPAAQSPAAAHGHIAHSSWGSLRPPPAPRPPYYNSSFVRPAARGSLARGGAARGRRRRRRSRPWKRLPQALNRMLKNSTRKRFRGARCGDSYTVGRGQRYQLTLRRQRSCSVIFRAGKKSSFSLSCGVQVLGKCSEARLTVATDTSTTTYCKGKTARRVSFDSLTEVLVTFWRPPTATRDALVKCQVLGKRGKGYKVRGRQPCPRTCGRTTPYADSARRDSLEQPRGSDSRVVVGEQNTPSLHVKVQGGQKASIGEWPWMVHLEVVVSGSSLTCGGTILSPSYVLTAAHCVYDLVKSDGDYVLAFAYEYDTEDNQETPRQVSMVKKIIVHPDFSNETEAADVAVLKLKTAFVFGSGVAAVCLAPPGDYEGATVTLLGWGSISYNGPESKKLREATMMVTSLQECAKNYSSLPATENQYLVTASHLCTAARGVDSCLGDSGGPILVRRGTTWYQVGIVSFGYKCAREGYPGVNTLVPAYLSWVMAATGKCR